MFRFLEKFVILKLIQLYFLASFEFCESDVTDIGFEGSVLLFGNPLVNY